MPANAAVPIRVVRAGLRAGQNPWEDRARALKVQRLALILHAAGLRRAAEVARMDAESRALALAVLTAGLRRGPQTASEATWRGVASVVGWLGGGSGGRRRVNTLVQSRDGLGS